MKKGRYAEAFESFLRLRNTFLLAERDFPYVDAPLEVEEVPGGSTFLSWAMELFTILRVGWATLASWVLVIGSQMFGINIMTFYSGYSLLRG